MTKETQDIMDLLGTLKEGYEGSMKEADNIDKVALQIRIDLLETLEKAIIKKYPNSIKK